jgi:putative solute:sodium symporter small subunit
MTEQNQTEETNEPIDPSPHLTSLAERNHYWDANIRILVTLLSVWALIAFGSSVLFIDWLDQFHIGGYPLGFWFSQQGAMLSFVVIIFVYHFWMTRIEKEYDVSDDTETGDA